MNLKKKVPIKKDLKTKQLAIKRIMIKCDIK
jgi:hypothetical protein